MGSKTTKGTNSAKFQPKYHRNNVPKRVENTRQMDVENVENWLRVQYFAFSVSWAEDKTRIPQECYKRWDADSYPLKWVVDLITAIIFSSTPSKTRDHCQNTANLPKHVVVHELRPLCCNGHQPAPTVIKQHPRFPLARVNSKVRPNKQRWTTVATGFFRNLVKWWARVCQRTVPFNGHAFWMTALENIWKS